MKIDKSLLAGSTAMLLLKLLESRDLYGYEMIEELERRSDHTFSLKAGTLYPLLHTLEKQGVVSSYETQSPQGRARKYYHLTEAGRQALLAQQSQWAHFSRAVNQVLGGMNCAF